jgi:hypothetical protein
MPFKGTIVHSLAVLEISDDERRSWKPKPSPIGTKLSLACGKWTS